MTAQPRPTFVMIMWFLWTGVCGAVLTLAGVFLYLNPQLPSAESYRHVRLETPLRVVANDGALIAEFGERRTIPVDLAKVPPLFIRAILDTEDKRFYEHGGVDLITLFNSTVDLVMNMGEITRGGSTITMQLPRNLGTFSLDQVFIRKFKEILLALKIERELTKDQILELYINVVPFGKRAYGAQAAAYTYYGKPLDQLNLAQMAMLAGIPQAPTAGNPINGPERALRRRNLVLQRMFEQGTINGEQFDHAVTSPVSARVHERTLDVSAPHAAEWVRQILVNRMGTQVYTGGFEATTTLRPELQATANLAIREGLLRYDRRHGYRGAVDHIELDAQTLGDKAGLASAMTRYPLSPGMEPALVLAVGEASFTALLGANVEVEVPFELMRWARPYVDVNARGPTPGHPADIVATGDVVNLRQLPEGWALAQAPDIQGALVSLDPSNGAVIAMVGGYDFANNQYNHAMQGGRQPGSGFKPFVYSAAIEHGITPASIFMDAPLVFEDENLETTYRPKNDGERYNGPTRLREGLYRSINLVSMRVLLAVGAGRVIDHAARFGFDTSAFPRNTQLAVGGGTIAITPLQMATAYATFANGGFLVTPHIVTQLSTLDGAPVFTDSYPLACDPCTPSPAAPTTDVSVATEPAATSGSAPRVVDERNAFIIDSMLRDVIARGTGRRARALERGDIAGKTGTTNEADNWFNGYQQTVATTVWVGFSDHRPLGDNEYGSNSPLPIWIDYMRVALDGVPEMIRPQPPGVVTMKIDPRSGEAVAPDQPTAISEFFLTEFAPEYRPKSQASPADGSQPVHPTDIF